MARLFGTFIHEVIFCPFLSSWNSKTPALLNSQDGKIYSEREVDDKFKSLNRVKPKKHTEYPGLKELLQ